MDEQWKCSNCGAVFDKAVHFDNHRWKAHGGNAQSRSEMGELQSLRAQLAIAEQVIQAAREEDDVLSAFLDAQTIEELDDDMEERKKVYAAISTFRERLAEYDKHKG